jgi:Tfp pilus assembly protein PilX
VTPRGQSLPGLLLALSLGAAAVILAIDRYQSVRTANDALLRREAAETAARNALFALARDLRMHGSAGCHVDLSGDPVRYGAPGWSVRTVSTDGAGQLVAVHLFAPEREVPLPARIVLASCRRRDILIVGEALRIERHDSTLRLALAADHALPVGGADGHHLPSLEVGPWVERHYVAGTGTAAGHLLREDPVSQGSHALAPAAGFSLDDDDEGWTIELRLPDEPVPWRLFVAKRQRGWALPTVLVLVSAAMLALSVNLRVQLDKSRMVGHLESWWPVLQQAETALGEAETDVAALARLPGHAQWFTPQCRAPQAAPGWQQGLCARAGPGGESQPVWARGAPSDVLASCGAAACIRVGMARGRPAPACPAEAGHLLPAVGACYVVELLDEAFREQTGLYRITVRAWDRRRRGSVTLQSYVAVGATVERLAWREIW